MKKAVQFFEMLGFMLVITLYPIVSFNWYRYCRVTGDSDTRKFVQYGILGIVGILGMAVMWFTPLPWKFLVAVPAGATYLLGGKLQMDLISKKTNPRTIL